MSAIKGIIVDISTASDWWSPTSDALFLGIYGKSGGREFRLNGEAQIASTDEEFTLVLGNPCCPVANPIQVQYSNPGEDNHPLLNPIEQSHVDYVYLRKETADSTSTNDDFLALDLVSVLLCDVDGQLRRFRKGGELNFADEVGLKHWLREVPPPRCLITVALHAISHEDEAQLPAGRNWFLDFGAGLTYNSNNMIDDVHHHVSVADRDEWTFGITASRSIIVEGCCGQTVEVVAAGFAREKDTWPFPDDTGQNHTHHNVQCGPERKTSEHKLDVIVDGDSKRRKSKITYHYTITSQCLM